MKRALLAAAACLFSVTTWAVDEDIAKASTPQEQFILMASQDGMMEVQMAELAQARSSTPEVKKFAAQMITDHGKANAELKSLAAKRGIQLPTQLDGEHATMLHGLSAKPASEFNSEYARHMAEAHAKAVTLFQDETATSDKELAAFAKKTLPILARHKQMADALNAQVIRNLPGEPPANSATN